MLLIFDEFTQLDVVDRILDGAGFENVIFFERAKKFDRRFLDGRIAVFVEHVAEASEDHSQLTVFVEAFVLFDECLENANLPL
jgi:hypothetical protein